MDEPGFIAQPPCLWGSPEHGLEEPYDANGQGSNSMMDKFWFDNEWHLNERS